VLLVYKKSRVCAWASVPASFTDRNTNTDLPRFPRAPSDFTNMYFHSINQDIPDIIIPSDPEFQEIARAVSTAGVHLLRFVP